MSYEPYLKSLELLKTILDFKPWKKISLAPNFLPPALIHAAAVHRLQEAYTANPDSSLGTGNSTVVGDETAEVLWLQNKSKI